MHSSIDSLEQSPNNEPLNPEVYKDIVWHSPVGIFTSTPAGRFTFANPAMARIYGYPSPAVMIDSITDISTQAYANSAERAQFQRKMGELGELINDEYLHLRRDGSMFWVSLNARAIYDQHGNLTHYHGFSTDITDRKNTASFIESRERYLQKILETSEEGFWVINATGLLQEVNQTYCAMSGYSREELLGLVISDLEALETPDETAARINRIKIYGAEIFVSLHRRKDGTIYPVEISVTWLDQDGGQMVCFCRDITERKLAEEALRKSEERFSLAMKASKDGIWDWDLTTGYIYCSPALTSMLGYDSTDVIEHADQWQDLIHPADKQIAYQANLDCVNNLADSFEIEYRMKTRDEGWKWILGRGEAVYREASGKALRMIGTHQDITERKRADEALKNSERFLRLTLDGLSAHIAVLDERGEIILTNKTYRDFGERNGVEPGAFSEGTNYLTVCDTASGGNYEEAGPFADGIREVISGKLSSFELEYPCHSLDEKRWFVGMVMPIQGEEFRWVVIAHENITERKQAEEQLRKSEEQFRNLYDEAPVGYFEYDLQGNITRMNISYLKMLDYSAEEVSGQPCWKFIVDEVAREQVLDKLRGVRPPAVGLERTYRRKDGTTFPVLFEDRVLTDEDGNISSIRTAIQDITERKLAEGALRESEEKFKALFEKGPIGVAFHKMVYDDSGKAIDYRFLDANSSYLDLTGVDPRGKCATEAFPGIENDSFDWIGTFGRVAKTGEQIRFEQYLKANKRWYDCVGYQFKPNYFVAAFVDITERKQAEAKQEKLQVQLNQAQKMESVGRLAGGVAHDFNNMLGVILGHIEMALEDVDPSLPLHASLQAVQHAAERSAVLTRQLLAFARKQTVAPRVIDINDTVEGMLNMLRRLIGEDIDLLWQPGQSLQPVKVDPSQLDQLLANLCVNARDAIAGVGKITIETDAKTDHHRDRCKNL